jgi:hypothetical protein
MGELWYINIVPLVQMYIVGVTVKSIVRVKSYEVKSYDRKKKIDILSL